MSLDHFWDIMIGIAMAGIFSAIVLTIIKGVSA